ncbi:MAG: hypothetical protein HWN65_02725 [Candidatus Helarchaeota archaeon]|nr:hypothetical protein [Candidatus Helarchaeota archaeon]
MKIVYIGAGSFRFSYGLFKNFCAMAKIVPLEIWLVDVDKPLLEIMARFLKRMVKKHKLQDTMIVQMTPDRRKALEHADMIVTSISIGHQDSEWYDIYIPQKFGIPQNTGDTVGPGGIFRTLRVVPVILDIVKDLAELCPNAIHLNYTNPQATIAFAARQSYPQVETIGICHELFDGMKKIHKLLKKLGLKEIPNWEHLDITYAGVNHFSWLFSCEYRGENLYPLIREIAEKAGKLVGRPFNFHLLRKYDYYCYPGSRHIAEFLPEYYNHFNRLEISKKWKITILRPVELLRSARRSVHLYFRQIAKGLVPCPSPSVKGERVIEMAVDWLESKAKTSIKDPSRYHPVNIPNTGHRLVSNLPENSILEVTGYFEEGHIKALPIGRMPNKIASLVQLHLENTPIFVEAATSGDPDVLLKALLADPMCQFIEDEEAIEHMMWNMLHYQRQWIPQFKESIPKNEDLEKMKYYVCEKDLKNTRQAKKVKWAPKLSLKEKAFFP